MEISISRPAQPIPASPEAVAQGCTCDPALNNNGRGLPKDGIFRPKWDCPVHGLHHAREALEADEAVVTYEGEDPTDDPLPAVAAQNGRSPGGRLPRSRLARVDHDGRPPSRPRRGR